MMKITFVAPNFKINQKFKSGVAWFVTQLIGKTKFLSKRSKSEILFLLFFPKKYPTIYFLLLDSCARACKLIRHLNTNQSNLTGSYESLLLLYYCYRLCLSLCSAELVFVC